ncbi:hypothetical protein QBC36DRAFT_370966 [Triangularia setosa]|uniref:Uncharacterized protein n=1 Tax=Triangularia setosa TaxID=2587417 RepID=A0AAN6VVW3_9PEZI|nr:hypothetical protein QBC36DRAFT_370966 [Podospora setosa]
MYQQFGREEVRSLQVFVYTQDGWYDGLARFSMEHYGVACSILSIGNRIAILTNIKKDGYIIVYDGVVFEEKLGIHQPERVLMTGANKVGTFLVSYGYLSTRALGASNRNLYQGCQESSKAPSTLHHNIYR